MNRNYNPYTVPDGFFEESRMKAVAAHANNARKLKYALLSAAVASVLIVVPVFFSQRQEPRLEACTECFENNLAVMYDCDVFLQVSF